MVDETSTRRLRLAAFTATIMASAVAVAPSYIDALHTSSPVSEAIMLWYSKIYCRVPCEISG